MKKFFSIMLSFVFIFLNTNMNFNLNKIITTAINNKDENNKIIIKTQGSIVASGTVLGNSIYFGSKDGHVYQYNFIENQLIKVIETKGSPLICKKQCFNLVRRLFLWQDIIRN